MWHSRPRARAYTRRRDIPDLGLSLIVAWSLAVHVSLSRNRAGRSPPWQCSTTWTAGLTPYLILSRWPSGRRCAPGQGGGTPARHQWLDWYVPADIAISLRGRAEVWRKEEGENRVESGSTADPCSAEGSRPFPGAPPDLPCAFAWSASRCTGCFLMRSDQLRLISQIGALGTRRSFCFSFWLSDRVPFRFYFLVASLCPCRWPTAYLI